MKDHELRGYLGIDDFVDGIPFGQTDGEIEDLRRAIRECHETIDILAETLGYKRTYKSAVPSRIVFEKLM